MAESPVHIPAPRLLAFLKQEAEGQYVNFHVNARKRHRPITDSATGQQTVIAEGTLDVEPLVEHNYWILRIIGTRDVGPGDDDVEAGAPVPVLTVSEFESEFVAPDDVTTSVRLIADTDEGREAFEAWVAPLRKDRATDSPR